MPGPHSSPVFQQVNESVSPRVGRASWVILLCSHDWKLLVWSLTLTGDGVYSLNMKYLPKLIYWGLEPQCIQVQRRLDHEDLRLRAEWAIRRWGLVGGSRSVEFCLQRMYLALSSFPLSGSFLLFLSLLSGCHEASSFALPVMMFCFSSGLRQWKQATMDWDLWNHESK